jgi:hypothetical protein
LDVSVFSKGELTHSPSQGHGIWAKKQLTEVIGEPLILDMALCRFFCLEK